MRASRTVPALLAALAIAVAACGGGGDNVSAGDAKSAVEKAAGVKLQSQPAPAKEVAAAYSTTEGGQVIQLFVLKDSGDADKIKDSVPATAAGGVKTAVNKNVVVIAGALPGGASKVDEVIAAVKNL